MWGDKGDTKMTIEEARRIFNEGQMLEDIRTKIGQSPSQLLNVIEFLLSERDRLETIIADYSHILQD